MMVHAQISADGAIALLHVITLATRKVAKAHTRPTYVLGDHDLAVLFLI